MARLDRDGDARKQSAFDEPIDWETFWALAHRHEVVPMVWAWLRADATRQLSVPEPIIRRAQRRYFATMIRNRAWAAELATVLRAFAAAGVEAMPVKGVAIAETVYGDIGLRSFDDLDLLVRSDDLEAARRVLGSLDYSTRAVPRFEEATHAFHDLQHFRQVAGGELCLELHWDLWSPAHFRSDSAGRWQRARAAEIAGEATRVLADEDVLVHLAIHRTRSPLRLRFVCDVAELVVTRGALLDWDALVERAEALGARTALYMILSLATELLDARVPDEVLRRLRPIWPKRVLLERSCGTTALFRSVRSGDDRQQPHLVYRVLELDGAPRIARALVAALFRKPAKWSYRRHVAATVRGIRAPRSPSGSDAPPGPRDQGGTHRRGGSADEDPRPVGGHEARWRERNIEALRDPHQTSGEQQDADDEEGGSHERILASN